MDPLSSPVFILGLHRSGTTLLYEMLSSAGIWNSVLAWHVIEFDALRSPGIDILQSKRGLGQRFKELGLETRDVDVVGISPDTKEEYGFILDNHGFGFALKRRSFVFFQEVCGVLQKTQPQPLPLLLKNPWDFPHPRQIKELIPSARFVCIHRDPLHVFSSMWRFTTRALERPMPYVTMLSRRYARLVRSSWKMSMLRFGLKLGADGYIRWLIRSCASRCRNHLREVAQVSHHDRFDVLYEDLCRFPEETIHGIMDHFELPIHDVDYRGMVGPRKSSVDPIVLKQKPLVEKLMTSYMSSVGLEFFETEADV